MTIPPSFSDPPVANKNSSNGLKEIQLISEFPCAEETECKIPLVVELWISRVSQINKEESPPTDPKIFPWNLLQSTSSTALPECPLWICNGLISIAESLISQWQIVPSLEADNKCPERWEFQERP